MTPGEHIRQRQIPIFGKRIFIGVCLAVLGAPAGYAAAASSDPAAACTGLANLTNFPVAPTQITSAQFNPAGAVSANGVPLPAHCQIDGIINKRVGSDGYPYGDRFEVRLPTPTDWNGRFMFQGGGGTEGSVPGEPLGNLSGRTRLGLEGGDTIGDAFVIDRRNRDRIGERCRPRPQFGRAGHRYLAAC